MVRYQSRAGPEPERTTVVETGARSLVRALSHGDGAQLCQSADGELVTPNKHADQQHAIRGNADLVVDAAGQSISGLLA